jgi:glycosyltransferase involved in cell wall biosynthesis
MAAMNVACVTIGIPCYNADRWIGACIRSALAQNWPEKDVIVVDDGSSDESLNILHKFGGAITVVQTEHRGSNHARNEILNLANGEWIQYLDADDYLLPEKISRQLAEAGDKECDVIYSPVWIENATTGTRDTGWIDPDYDIYMQWMSWQMPQTGGCLWRRSALAGLQGWNEAMPCCQEHELYLRALKGGLRFSFAPTPNAVYRIWSEQTLCRRDPRQVVHERTELMDDLRGWMQKRRMWNKRHNAVAARAFFEMSRTLAKYDLAEAADYHAARKKLSLINPQGPAAPFSYLLGYWTLGFSGAEKLARALR